MQKNYLPFKVVYIGVHKGGEKGDDLPPPLNDFGCPDLPPQNINFACKWCKSALFWGQELNKFCGARLISPLKKILCTPMCLDHILLGYVGCDRP